MTQLITTNNQQHVCNVTDDVGITLLHLSPNVITLRSLLHLRAVITFRSSTTWYGFYNHLGSDPITGIGQLQLGVIYPYDEEEMLEEDRGVALFYLDPPLWRRQIMVRNEEGHLVYRSTEGHLVVRTGRYHGLGPPYCSCSF